MTTLTVYDPPMCCSTGICGSDVDQRLVDLAADLDWLKALGVSVRRINLSQEPMEFVSQPAIKALMDETGGDDLPAILVDGKIVSQGRYPLRAELSAMAQIGGVDATGCVEVTAQIRELIALGAAIGASCESCLKFHVKASRDLGLSDAVIREAIEIGETVKAASARNIATLADKLLPVEAVAAAPNGGGAKTQAEPKVKAGSCC